MRLYYREIAKERLAKLFEEADAETVLTWLEANDGRKPVVVVGAGFSLNAKNKRTGLCASRDEAPLWSDVIRRFELDLELKGGHQYDALTLAELHREALQPAAHCSVLLELFKDDELLPGAAHAALFEYPAAAIVTTNALDTLLDKHDQGWAKIVEDSDLGLRSRDSARDLIYFHGHRSVRSSWVFTRSQYENIFRDKPLIVTKVRQLLSQNPVLIVGFGLGDPDFHQIYRQLSLDMRNHHPLGLALFPHGSGPRSFERAHWAKLGIRTAELRDTDSVGNALAGFFQLSPTFQATIDDATTIAAQIRKLPAFVDRRALAEDFLTDDRSVQEHPSAELEKEAQVWEAVVASEFTEEEWRDIGQVYIEDLRYNGARFRNGDWSSGKSKFMGFSELPHERFSVQSSFLRRIDAFLRRCPELRLELARWMTFGFRRGIELGREDEFLHCLSWLWTRIATSGPVAPRDEISKAMRSLSSFAIAGRLRDAEPIRKDAAAAGVDITDVGPAEDYHPEYVAEMHQGRAALFDGKFAQAGTSFEAAARVARAERNALCEWFALSGRLNARSAEITEKRIEWALADAELDSVRHQLRLLQDTPVVQRWQGRCERLRDAVRKLNLGRMLAARRQVVSGGRTMTWSKIPPDLLSVVRELEAIHAPPGLLREWIEPLIDLEFFDSAEEFRHRLRLAIGDGEKTVDWLRRITTDPALTVSAASERDRALVCELRRDGVTKSELVQRVLVFPQLAPLLWADDLDWAAEFPEMAKRKLGAFTTTWDATYSFRKDYADCWLRYAEHETRPQVLDRLETYSAELVSLEREFFVRKYPRLPLRRWVGLFPESEKAGERLVKVLLDRWDAAKEADEESSLQTAVGWGLYELLDGLRQYGGSISPTQAARARAWAEEILEASAQDGGKSDYDGHGAAFHVKWLSASDESSQRSTLEQGLKLVEQLSLGGARSLVAAAALLERILEAGIDCQDETIETSAGKLESRITSAWDELTSAAKSNEDHARRLVRFYCRLLSWGSAATPGKLRAEVLQLVARYPNLAAECDVVLKPEYWDESWQNFVECLRDLTYARSEERRVESAVGVASLVEGWVETASQGERWPRKLDFLPESLFARVWDRSPIVANRCAYAVLRCAVKATEGSDVVRIQASIADMAKDPRLTVRGAAAYGAGLLARESTNPTLIELADGIESSLTADPYAHIQRQLVLGKLAPRARP